MGIADIIKSGLESRVIRQAVTNGVTRRIRTGDITHQEGQADGLISMFWGWTKQLVGFIASGIGSVVRWSATTIWSLIVSTSQFIWNFNWNATDEDLDKQIQSIWNSVAGQLGGTIGQALGWLACGAIPGAIVFTFNEALGLHILKQVGEEAAEELAGSIGSLIRATFRASANSLIAWSYKSVRKLIKSKSDLIGKFFGDGAKKVVDAWGEKGSKPWSFAKATEDAIESIPNEALRNFTEELLEEFFESCVEAGYVVAGAIDSYVAAQKPAREFMLGQQRIVEVTPNRDLPNEKVILAGNERLLMPQIVSTLANHQLLENKDIGDDLGGFQDRLLASEPLSVQITIVWYSLEKPPYSPKYTTDKKRPQRAECTIPCVKRSALTWQNVKTAAGGINGYNWGRFKAEGRLKGIDGGMHTMSLYGASDAEAQERFLALASLSNGDVVELKIIEEKKIGRRANNAAMYKESKRVYPAWFAIINQKRVLAVENSRKLLQGDYKLNKTKKIHLYWNSEPVWVEEVINDLFKIPGVNPD